MRVMKPIQTQPRNIRPIKYSGGNDLAIYTYLAEVEYQVQAHFEWNLNRDDLAKDRNENKHFFVARRMIDCGGRRDVFLGTRECQAYIEPCEFGEDTSFYDTYPGEMAFGLMFHGFDYPDETGTKTLVSRFWYPRMVKGIIEFPHPEDCSIRKEVGVMQAAPPDSIGLQEEGLLDGYVEGA